MGNPWINGTITKIRNMISAGRTNVNSWILFFVL